MKVETPALPRLEPALDGGAFVRAVVVEDEMDIEIRRHFFLQLIEELDELFAAMAGQTGTDDLAIQDVEGGKKCCRSSC